jgi:hypothetical protein
MARAERTVHHLPDRAATAAKTSPTRTSDSKLKISAKLRRRIRDS